MSNTGTKTVPLTYETIVEGTTPVDAATLLRQIGGGNVAAISGGRCDPILNNDNEVVGVWLPVGGGYHVHVTYNQDDTYTVRRVFIRNGFRDAGTEAGHHYDTVGDAAYRASCHVNVAFGTN